MVLISFKDLYEIHIFPEFHRCGSTIIPATPIWSSKIKRHKAQFLSNTYETLENYLFFMDPWMGVQINFNEWLTSILFYPTLRNFNSCRWLLSMVLQSIIIVQPWFTSIVVPFYHSFHVTQGWVVLYLLYFLRVSLGWVRVI